MAFSFLFPDLPRPPNATLQIILCLILSTKILYHTATGAMSWVKTKNYCFISQIQLLAIGGRNKTPSLRLRHQVIPKRSIKQKSFVLNRVLSGFIRVQQVLGPKITTGEFTDNSVKSVSLGLARLENAKCDVNASYSQTPNKFSSFRQQYKSFIWWKKTNKTTTTMLTFGEATLHVHPEGITTRQAAFFCHYAQTSSRCVIRENCHSNSVIFDMGQL